MLLAATQQLHKNFYCGQLLWLQGVTVQQLSRVVPIRQFLIAIVDLTDTLTFPYTFTF